MKSAKQQQQQPGKHAPVVWTEEYVKQLLAEGKIAGYVITRKRKINLKEIYKQQHPDEKGVNKFGATAVIWEGERFDSIRERREYVRLQWQEKMGLINNLRRQVPYELNEGGEFNYRYIADFVYNITATGMEVVHDAKGNRTKEYKKKKKLMLRIHGIDIKET